MKKILLITFVTVNCFAMEPNNEEPRTKSWFQKISEKLFKKLHQKRAFFGAVADGNAPEVERLLQLGVNPNTPERARGLAFCTANTPEGDGWFALCTAAYFGHVDVCRVLLDAHAAIDAANNKCSPALHIAADEGHPEVCKLLIARGANVNIVWEGSTALLDAAQSGLPEICQLLVDAGADVNATNNSGVNALVKAMYTTQFGHDDYPTTSTFQERLGNTALIFQILINAGINVNNAKFESCPLKYALALHGVSIDTGSEILVQQLLSAGADIKQIGTESLRYLFENHPKFLGNIVCAPNLNDIAACRKKIVTVLWCFKRLGHVLPKDIQHLILSHIPDHDLGKLLIHRKLQGFQIPNNLKHKAVRILCDATFLFWMGICDSLIKISDPEALEMNMLLLQYEEAYRPKLLETINTRLDQQKLLCNGMLNF